jgi:hypothetical protein
MPADPELAAFACGFGGLMLGVLIPDVASLMMGRTVAVGVSQRPWWLVGLLAATALVFAIQVTGWMLRVALIAFSVGRVLSIRGVANALSIGAVTITAVNGLFAGALIVAAWPKAGRLAKVVACVLFVAAAALRFWLRGSASSVFR